MDEVWKVELNSTKEESGHGPYSHRDHLLRHDHDHEMSTSLGEQKNRAPKKLMRFHGLWDIMVIGGCLY